MAESFNHSKKEALLIMFGQSWSHRFGSLDGQEGRPSIAECIDKALEKNTLRAHEDLVDYVEKHLTNVSRRFERFTTRRGQ